MFSSSVIHPTTSSRINQQRFWLPCVGSLMVALMLGACQPTTQDAQTSTVSHAEQSAKAEAATEPAADTRFVIEGDIKGVAEGTKVALRLKSFEKMGYAAPLVHGKVANQAFRLTGELPSAHAAKAKLLVGNDEYAPLIVEPGITHQAIMDGAGTLYVEGGKVHKAVYGYASSEEFLSLMKQVSALIAKLDDDKQSDERKAAWKKELYALYDEAGALKKAHQHRVLSGDASALVKLFTLIEHRDKKTYDDAARAKMFDAYEQALGDHPAGKLVARQRIRAAWGKKVSEAGKALKEKQPFKEVSALAEDGTAVKLSDVVAKNKLVLLDFWASWCSSCRADFPHLRGTYAQFKDRGLEIYAVSLDDERSDWLEASKEENITWLDYHLPKAFESEMAIQYGVAGIPSNFLIDQSGQIIAINEHEEALNDVIAEYLDTH